MNVLELEKKPLLELRQIAMDFNIPKAAQLKKEKLVMLVRQAEAERDGLEVRGGILEIMSEGIGFLRWDNYQPSSNDV